MVHRWLVLAIGLLISVSYALGEEEGAAAAAASEAPAPTKAYPEVGLQAEAGIAVAGGNTRSQTYSAKADGKLLWEKDVVKAFAQYFLSNSLGTKVGENWKFGARYERAISDRFGVYLGNSWEGDRFAGFAYRTNVDAGGQYYIFPGDRKENYWVTEAGYRYTYESRSGIVGATAASITAHAVRLYTDASKKLTKSILGRVWVEVLPDLSTSSNLLINFEPSLSVVLSGTFSLKLAFLGKYDGLPAKAGNKKFDYLYTTSLVATF